MNWIECIILFAVALGVTIALTPLARRLAIALDAIDYPSARRVNMQPIPRMGGVAIFGGMVAALALALVGAHFWGWTTPLQGGLGNKVNWIGVAVGILIMFGVGIVDDIYNLKPKAKLLGQIVAACVVAFSGLLFSSIHNFISDGYFEFGWLSYPLTVFYLVAFANIINLIDGLDGLAAGITAITAATIGILAVLTWRPGAALASFVIVGACIGFLKSNIHPASIFMGDSGALLLGFALGIVSLMAVARSAFFVSLLVPIIAAGVPILDTAIAIIRRKRAHQPIDSADRRAYSPSPLASGLFAEGNRLHHVGLDRSAFGGRDRGERYRWASALCRLRYLGGCYWLHRIQAQASSAGTVASLQSAFEDTQRCCCGPRLIRTLGYSYECAQRSC